MNTMTFNNKAAFPVNLATCRDGNLGKVYNQLQPGSTVYIETAEEGWHDFIVMASDESNSITREKDWLDVVELSLDSAERYGAIATKIKRAVFNKKREAFFASIEGANL
jgi:hypothetical protein